MKYFFILILFAFVSISAFSQSYLVSGAGTPGVNGLYSPTGTNVNLYPSYTNGSFFIYYHSGPNSWLIDDNTSAGGWNELYYHDSGSGNIPIENVVWKNTNGALGISPNPTVTLDTSSAVPVSPWSIVASMFLIGIFTIYRVRKKNSIAIIENINQQ